MESPLGGAMRSHSSGTRTSATRAGRPCMNCWLSRIWWWGRWEIHWRSIERRRNARPGRITLHACCRVPIRYSSSLRLQTLREDHCPRVACMRSNLSRGRQRTPAVVSISIPRNVRQGTGPYSLSMASGTPRSAQVSMTVLRAVAHSEEPGGPSTIKLSR